ncbi:MAG: hypothetical protein BM556_05540 [Bacteriovorax sp. MedPE-SWde]|nr:MAG: hypothetical protein BM556_05540 [Bacteriovorax sp. MedPE-SWde]
MKKLLIATLITFKTFAADVGLNPDFLNLKVYKVAISQSEYCTNMKTVFSKDALSASYENFLNAPTIGSGTVDLGTYKCIAIEFEDIIQFASLSNSDSGNCSAGVQLDNEICRGTPGDAIKFIDGTSATCSNGAQKTTMWLSTGSTNAAQTGSPFLPPHAGDTNLGIQLLAPLVVSEGSIAKFVVNALGKIEDNGAQCEMMQPVFTFENL